jgi:hypothetical protein
MRERAKKIHLDFNILPRETSSAAPAISEPPVGAVMKDDALRIAAHVPESSELLLGGVQKDGTVFPGISPDTHKPMYAMPADAPLTMTFNDAAIYAIQARWAKHLGYDDWRVPSKNELSVLFNNRAAIGGFDISGSYPAGWYWSSSEGNRWGTWCQRFSDGLQAGNLTDAHASVRLVRSPQLPAMTNSASTKAVCPTRQSPRWPPTLFARADGLSRRGRATKCRMGPSTRACRPTLAKPSRRA